MVDVSSGLVLLGKMEFSVPVQSEHLLWYGEVSVPTAWVPRMSAKVPNTYWDVAETYAELLSYFSKTPLIILSAVQLHSFMDMECPCLTSTGC